MTLPKTAKPEAIASANKNRSSITEPYLDIETLPGTEDTRTCDGVLIPGVSVRVGRLISTDGMAMAILPVDLNEHDVEGYVSGAVLAAARKQAGKLDKAIVTCNSKAELPDGSTMPRGGNDGDKYPNWRQVVPAPDKVPVFRISLDASLLFKLATALGSTGRVTLEFAGEGTGLPDNTAAIVVKVPVTGGHGLLMPMRLQ